MKIRKRMAPSKKYPVDNTVASLCAWPGQRGEEHRLITWDDNGPDGPNTIQMELVRVGDSWNIRIEEWSSQSPELLRVGKSCITIKPPVH